MDVRRALRSRREVFTNPTAGVAAATAPSRTPMPLDTDRIRHALNAPNPARALAVALVAFHGLTAREIRNLRLTDAHDGRLRVGRRDIGSADRVAVHRGVVERGQVDECVDGLGERAARGIRHRDALDPVDRGDRLEHPREVLVHRDESAPAVVHRRGGRHAPTVVDR